jgi:hypothetical protein
MARGDVTVYPDINQIINTLSDGIVDIFGDKLVGIYLFGSLSYGDFNPARSDIDLVTILKNPASIAELKLTKGLHRKVEEDFSKWAKRIENSFTPQHLLPNIKPPREPRPYYGEGVFYPQAKYGNEWLINLYLMYHHSIALVGPEFNTLIKPIDIQEVRKACVRDLAKEWEPKLKDSVWLNNSHYQSYLVLNLCRILYTVFNASVASKKGSRAWVMKQFPEWQELIKTADNWHYGLEMDQKEKTLEFLKFAISKVKEVDRGDSFSK